LRASHPDSGALTAHVRRLAGTLSDPSLTVTRAEGEVVIEGNSLRFDLHTVELPHSRGTLKGLVRWGRPGTSVEAAVGLSRFAFADLAGAVPSLPREGGGRAALRLRLPAGGGADVEARELEFETGRTVAAGSGRVTVGPRGGVSLRGLDVTMMPLDLALLAPFTDSLPVAGLVRGRLRATGSVRDLSVDADLTFTDQLVPGGAFNAIVARGRAGLGGADGLRFHRLQVQRGDVDLRTVRRLAPPVTLAGRLGLVGALVGPWRDAAFDGTLRHTAPGEVAAAATALRGRAHLTLADTLRVQADLTADSLSWDLLHHSYPALPLRGAAAGSVRLDGPLTALGFTFSLAGPGGSASGQGTVSVRDSVVEVRASGTMERVDLSAQREALPPTLLTGTFTADVVVPLDDTTAATIGRVGLVLGEGHVAGVALRRAAVAAALGAERLTLDSAAFDGPAGTAVISGALGRGPHPPGQLGFTVRADALQLVAPLVRWYRAQHGDSTPAPELSGAGRLVGRVVGTLDEWEAEATLLADSLRFGAREVHQAALRGRLSRGLGPYAVAVEASADSVLISGLGYTRATAVVRGPLDSLELHGAARFARAHAVRVAGLVAGDSSARRIRLDTLTLSLAASTWRLTYPGRAVITRDSLTVDSLELRAGDSARLRAQGSLPRAGVGDFLLVAYGVPLVDAYALIERDTTGIGGTADFAVHLAGPAATPTIEIRLGLDQARFGSYRAPALMVLGSYADRRLSFKGGLWEDSIRVLALNGTLPLDLSLTAVERRQLPGAIQINARSEAVAMEPLGALTDLIQDVGGVLDADIHVGGAWDDPELSGFVEVRRGAFTIPALGARYTDADVRLELQGGEIRVARGRLRGGDGTLDIAGTVRLESLSRPVLALDLTARGFHAFELRDFAGLTGSGALTLRGPAIGATLSGRLTVDHGWLAFADLVEKRIVNLDDPEFRAIVDANLARAAGLGPDVETVLLDSLRVVGLTVAMGNDVWLRSTEANIQLDGEFRVEKAVEEGLVRYRLDGTLRAVRGTYRLTLAFTSKEFRVTRGTVRFFGTPDFDPELDIAAEHQIRPVEGGQIAVRAVIGGTLLAPRLTLESDHRPPLSETELVSYLLFGRPSFDLVAAGQGSRNERSVLQTTLTGSLIGELGQGLVSTLGLPVDYLAFRPGAATQADPLGFSTTRLEAGTQIGEKTFVTLNAGLCEVRTSQLVGASVEYRLNPRWTVEASLEPLVTACRSGLTWGAQTSTTAKYQVGFDLFWQTGNR
jgi:translocation and assembly module TamB